MFIECSTESYLQLVGFLSEAKDLVRREAILVSNLLYNLLVFPSVSQKYKRGNVIFSAVIEDIQLKFSVNIPMT